jgi:predicted peptidase
MRSRLLGVTLALGAAACSGSDSSSVCVVSVTNPCTNPIDTTGTGGGTNVTTGFVTKSVVVDGVTYGYQVFVPANYNSQAKVPVILFLHGSGEKGSDNVAQTNVGLGPVVKAQATTFPAIVVFPQAPVGEATRATFLKIANASLDKTVSEYSKADATRIYLTGLSYGGIATFDIAYARPTTFAAVVPISATICAGCLTGSSTTTFAQGVSLAATALKTVPIWQFHGQIDAQVSVNDARAIETAFKANGDPYTLTVYPADGHDIWNQVYTYAAMWTWLYLQRR